jgi:nicotinamide mononucleotide adenylyltransferase
MEFPKLSSKFMMQELGSAHGRFQPLHNGHLEYLLGAKVRCRYLWIGITQYNIKNLSKSPENRHRELPFNNPLTYFERVEMITNALVSRGVPRSEFGTIPFPVETPHLLHDYLPTNITIYTTICDDWNRHKISLLVSLGYKVIVLWEKEKLFEGSKIRLSISRGENDWENDVPETTKRLVEKYNIRSRLQGH